MRPPLLLAALLLACSPAEAAQDALQANTEISGPTLAFDWPAVEIGIV